MSETALLYLKQAEGLVNDASGYVELCKSSVPAPDDDLRESMIREVMSIKGALLAIKRHLTEFTATVNRETHRKKYPT